MVKGGDQLLVSCIHFFFFFYFESFPWLKENTYNREGKKKKKGENASTISYILKNFTTSIASAICEKDHSSK